MVPAVARRLLYREPLSVAAQNRLYRPDSILDRSDSAVFLAIITIKITTRTYICLSKAANSELSSKSPQTK